MTALYSVLCEGTGRTTDARYGWRQCTVCGTSVGLDGYTLLALPHMRAAHGWPSTHRCPMWHPAIADQQCELAAGHDGPHRTLHPGEEWA